MSTRYEMHFTGAGGQGVILCSIILAEAAFLAGKNVAQSQSYGPEARGGLCQAELIIDAGEIVYPKLTRADFLLALTQPSLNKYGPGTAEDALIVIDKTLSKPDNLVSVNVVALPILQTASQVIGNPLTANIIAAGAVNALLGIAPDNLMEQAVRMHIPWGTEQINLLALREGRGLAAGSPMYRSLSTGRACSGHNEGDGTEAGGNVAICLSSLRNILGGQVEDRYRSIGDDPVCPALLNSLAIEMYFRR